MRLKFLSFIASFLIVSIAVSSCLDSDTNYEFSTDATIHAFAIDTIYGKDYKFEIDQIQRIIYNRDSLPMSADTLIDSIKITTLTTTSGVVMSGTPDTLLNIENYQNLLPAMNTSPGMTLKVMAADGITKREYHLVINVHKEDPDSLVWKKMGNMPSSIAGTPKAVTLGDGLIVYATPATGYKTSTVPADYNWQAVSSNMPADADLSSLLNHQDTLLVCTSAGSVWASTDGANWSEREALGTNVTSLVASFPANEASGTLATISAIVKDATDGKMYFATTASTQTAWTRGEEVPEGFPTSNYSACANLTSNGLNKAFLVGNVEGKNEQTVPWSSMLGIGWVDLSTPTDAHCPALSNPYIMYYGDALYIFGGKLESFYKSATGGIAWEKQEKKFLFPAEFATKGTSYTATVDKNNFIWIVWGGSTNEVWRGCLNKLKKY